MIKSKIKDLFQTKKGYVYYIVGEGLSKGIIFLLLAFYTNILGKENFGKLALFWVSVPLFSVLIDLSQRSYVKYFYINEGQKTTKLIAALKYFCLLSALILLVIFYGKNYFGYYFIDELSDYFILFSALFFAIIELYLSFFQIKGDFKSYNFVFILRNAFPYVAAAFVLQFFSGDVYSFMKVQLFLFIILALFLSKKDILKKVPFDSFVTFIKPSIKFSAPFIPAILSVLALSFADRFIINYYHSEVEVAEYTVAYTVSSIFMAFFLATNKMWQKFILESLKANDLTRIIKNTKIYLVIVLVIAVAIILMRSYLVSIMSNSSYFVILDIIPTIIIGMYFYFLYTVLSNIPFYYKDTVFMALPAIIAATLNILLNFILIPIYGYKVAALATTISYFTEFVVIYAICLKKYKTDILFNGLTKRFIQSS